MWYGMLFDNHSKVHDDNQIYEMVGHIVSSKQHNQSVTEYYHTIKSLWLESDHLEKLQLK